jgi:hypothetical protein
MCQLLRQECGAWTQLCHVRLKHLAQHQHRLLLSSNTFMY